MIGFHTFPTQTHGPGNRKEAREQGSRPPITYHHSTLSRYVICKPRNLDPGLPCYTLLASLLRESPVNTNLPRYYCTVLKVVSSCVCMMARHPTNRRPALISSKPGLQPSAACLASEHQRLLEVTASTAGTNTTTSRVGGPRRCSHVGSDRAIFKWFHTFTVGMLSMIISKLYLTISSSSVIEAISLSNTSNNNPLPHPASHQRFST